MSLTAFPFRLTSRGRLALSACFISCLNATLAWGQARLSELQPLNTGVIHDQDGATPPWIEIWNSSSQSILSLQGYQLVHGAVTWTFPAFHLMPDEHVVIFASGRNLREPTAPLHTSFTLNPLGGAVELRHSSGNLISLLSYPALSPGVSWGRDEWDTAVTPTWTGPYDEAIPGERNRLHGPAHSSEVAFSVPSQAFLGSLTVTLSAAIPEEGADIYYTLDKSVPTPASLKYTEPITLTNSRMVRARVYKPGRLPGSTATAAYLGLDATTRNFTSRIPLAVISSFTTAEPPADGDQEAFLWLWEPGPDGTTSFSALPSLATRIAIDKRGSSTLNNPKFNLNVQLLNDADNDDQDIALLGMKSHDDWVFHAPYQYNRALLRNPFIYQLSRSIGRYAPDSRMAEVFIDVTGGNLRFTGTTSSDSDYFGVYNLMERPRRHKDRIAIRKLETYDNTGESLTGGYIWKVDRVGSGETGFFAGGQQLTYYVPREREIKSPQRAPQATYLRDYLNEFHNALNSPTWTDPQSGYAAWLDVPATIDYHLLNLWSYNVDAFRLSTYWHKDAGGKIAAGPVWDFDRSLSSTDEIYGRPRDENPAEWGNGRWPEGGFFAAHWWSRLFQDPDFYQHYIDRWQELRRGPFAEMTVNRLLDSLNDAIGPSAVSRDLNRWQRAKRPWTGTHARHPVTRASQEAEVQRIKDYLQVRADFFDSQWVGPVTVSPPSGPSLPGAALTLSGPEGATIYYTLNGADPRPSGGGPPLAAAQEWRGEPIIITGRTLLRARAYNPHHPALTGGPLNPPLVSKWGGLTETLYAPEIRATAGTLVISEIHFKPAPPSAAEAAQNPAWESTNFEFLELQNLSDHPLDLGGVSLTQGIRYTFSDNGTAILPPHGRTLIVSDPLAFLARYGSDTTLYGPWSGNLSNSGETIECRAADGSLIQAITYNDKWAPAADTQGYSLIAYDVAAEPLVFNSSLNWRASAEGGGSPGRYDPHSAPRVRLEGPATSGLQGLTLAASMEGGYSNGAPQLTWSQLSGPGTTIFSPLSEASTTILFSQSGEYVLRITASDGITTSTADHVVTVAETELTLIDWLSSRPQIGGALDDFDQDGLSNLLEFAFDTDPEQASWPNLPHWDADSPALVFRKRRSNSGVRYQLELSSDLHNFHSANSEEFIETILETGERNDLVRWQVTSPARPLFLRLHVVAEP